MGSCLVIHTGQPGEAHPSSESRRDSDFIPPPPLLHISPPSCNILSSPSALQDASIFPSIIEHAFASFADRHIHPAVALGLYLRHHLPRNEDDIMTSLWNPENIRDCAESVGISKLNEDAAEALAKDVEHRLALVIEEALKFMRHARRTTLWTQDISQALSVLGVEPLYGYESMRPLRFGEASLGPGQPLFYVEDEEVDFEKLINAPLPRVPKEMSLAGKEIVY
jgi:histone H3/H4